jgi:hypothetical protein
MCTRENDVLLPETGHRTAANTCRIGQQIVKSRIILCAATYNTSDTPFFPPFFSPQVGRGQSIVGGVYTSGSWLPAFAPNVATFNGTTARTVRLVSE